MCAVLRAAILELRSFDARTVIEAEEWILADADGNWPFSFRNICAALNLEPTYLARGLLAWHARPMDFMRGRVRSSPSLSG